MRKIKDVTIIVRCELSDLSHAINQGISMGWEPQGGIFIVEMPGRYPVPSYGILMVSYLTYNKRKSMRIKTEKKNPTTWHIRENSVFNGPLRGEE